MAGALSGMGRRLLVLGAPASLVAGGVSRTGGPGWSVLECDD